MEIMLTHYEEDFAKAVIDAMFKGKKTFVFEHTRYTTSHVVENVLDDLKCSFFNGIKMNLRSFLVNM